ncbi:MAG: response regulator [Ignavibacteriaceae bacterium]|jgi:Response regulators consisting of a CheY-like receiver domain and a winged-helix DNA-binding domain|nr:MAG: response regulator [Chlorobiota bacterium]KXK04887.1 MAG: CheY-like receiver-like protein [Chlorobi bacterium OLB4]MBV6397704.1 Transcriptional regulatory protein OmpR [Ignavibacteria bacterium]MCE7952836.1 response regulator [Chlorobi bacterium CHB7]MEB2328769.1 response regulator [Ignavibacteriaceae bacterium]OQY79071.1 MAG: hypothetical protein B6D43_00295 [Ignavibacteriales bacterium UTCHB1]RIK49597.1 MAG: hypothetical protein DCC60_02830 [Ignavibacteriota bacterium]
MNPSGYKVLVVEDNFINQKLIEKLLLKKGFKVFVSSNGKQAMELYHKEKFDLILMDIQMPLMDGFEATIEIRRLEESKSFKTPIIAVTAFAMETDRVKCFEMGMDDYLPKPFTKEEFYKVIERNLPSDK